MIVRGKRCRRYGRFRNEFDAAVRATCDDALIFQVLKGAAYRRAGNGEPTGQAVLVEQCPDRQFFFVYKLDDAVGQILLQSARLMHV
jgi:hypothetical protein